MRKIPLFKDSDRKSDAAFLPLKAAKILLTTVILNIGIATDAPLARTISLIQKDLFFGQNIPGGREVSQREFTAFIDNTITPRFPDGLTIFNAEQQFFDSTGKVVKQPSKVITLFIEDSLKSERAIEEILREYSKKFASKNVLQVTNKDELKIGFGTAQNLIDSDPVSELIEVNLFFGRNIPGGGEVSKTEFAAFIDSKIIPYFPDGLTIYDADGKFRNSAGAIIKESSKVVTILLEDTPENEITLDRIIASYIEQFNQETVLMAVNENISVGLDARENLINSDPVSKSIEITLFLGGNTSIRDLTAFIDNTITSQFSQGLTIIDARRKFRDRRGKIVEQTSQVVTLLLEDTRTNEIALDGIIEAYIEQFDRDSIVLVVDENVAVGRLKID